MLFIHDVPLYGIFLNEQQSETIGIHIQNPEGGKQSLKSACEIWIPKDPFSSMTRKNFFAFFRVPSTRMKTCFWRPGFCFGKASKLKFSFKKLNIKHDFLLNKINVVLSKRRPLFSTSVLLATATCWQRVCCWQPTKIASATARRVYGTLSFQLKCSTLQGWWCVKFSAEVQAVAEHNKIT